MTTPLEQATERVLLEVQRSYFMGASTVHAEIHGEDDRRNADFSEAASDWAKHLRAYLVEVLRNYGEQCRIEGANAMRQAMLVDPVMWEPHRIRICNLDPAQIVKEMNHGTDG